MKRHPQILEELYKLCKVVPGATPFLLIQVQALNTLTASLSVRLSPDLEDRFLTGDLQPQELSALAAAGIHTGNGSQNE